MKRSPSQYGSRSGSLLCMACLLGTLLCLAGCQSAGPSTTPARTTTPQPRFVDVAESSGLRYVWKIGDKTPYTILQLIGNGCAFLDYDGDGNLDILLVGPKLALYKSDGKGHFTDVTQATGLDKLSGHFLGCAVGDYDNDGFDDVYISAYRGGILLHNEGGKGFRDVTAQAGIKPQPWGTSCGFADLDGDGRLDLYVCNYAVFGPDTKPLFCNEKGVMTSCGPHYYKPIRGVLYHNEGGGRFTDVTSTWGATSVQGRGLGIAFVPMEDTKRPAVYLANDETEGDLLLPSPTGKPLRYTNMANRYGVARDRDGNIHGGMGTDWGDYDNDGKFDLFVATFHHETKSLYHNEGSGTFIDMGTQANLEPALPYVAFGCKFLDYDNDGWLDLVIANGHVQDNIKVIDPTASYRQPTQLFHNLGSSPDAFEDVSATSGPDLQRPIVGRGLAVGDYDNDGRLDLLVVDSEGKPLLLHNQGSPVGHWLTVRLVGTKSNRDGFGALLTASFGGRTLVRQCQSAGSYLSASDSRVHFGLADAKQVDSLTVRWPSGHTDTYQNLPADRIITLHEGSPTVQ